MKHNIYIYILVMFAVTYLIRVLPLTLIRKEIKNKTIRSFSVLCALCHAGGYDVSGNYGSDKQSACRTCGTDCRNHSRMVWTKPVSGCGIVLRGSVRAGIIFVMWLYFRIMKADSDNLSSASDC